MRVTLAVAAREIAERKILFLGAFVTGLLPLGFPLIPALRGNSRDARSVAVLLGAAILAVALSIAFGATILVGDIVQKRLGFYLSRPLSSVSIWGGKLLAAFSISAPCVVLTVAPLFLVEGEGAFSAQTGGFGLRRLFLFTFAGVLLLILIAHIVSSMVRLQSSWIVPDFLLAITFTIWIVLTLHSLFIAGFWNRFALTHSEWPIWVIAIPLISILLVASYVQIADGRADSRRSHGALSATLWGILLSIALPLTGLSWWVDAATPKDLVSILDTRVAPRGAWVTLYGPLRARGSATSYFLYEANSGRFIEHPSWELRFSASGRYAAWAQGNPGLFERKSTVRIVDLDAGQPAAIDANLEMTGASQLALSPSGHTLAISDGKTLSAYDVSSPSNPRQVGAFRVTAGGRVVQFVDENRIRLFPFDLRRTNATTSLEIEEISLSSKESLVTGHVDAGPLTHLRSSADGRFLVGSDDKRHLTLHDGRTGALLSALSDDLSAPTMRFLSGSQAIVAGISNGNGVLKIFFEGGKTPPSVVGLGAAASLVLGGEVAPGRVAISLNPFQRNDERARRAWKLAFVDVATGAVSPGPDGLVPVERFQWWSSVLPPAESGLPSSLLFLDADDCLVRLDPATGAQTVLLGRSK